MPSRDLHRGFLVGTQKGHIGDADEGPPLAGPELDDGALLGDLGRSIEVGEAHAAQVGGKANEDVPGEGDRRVRARGRETGRTSTLLPPGLSSKANEDVPGEGDKRVRARGRETAGLPPALPPGLTHLSQMPRLAGPPLVKKGRGSPTSP